MPRTVAVRGNNSKAIVLIPHCTIVNVNVHTGHVKPIGVERTKILERVAVILVDSVVDAAVPHDKGTYVVKVKRVVG